MVICCVKVKHTCILFGTFFCSLCSSTYTSFGKCTIKKPMLTSKQWVKHCTLVFFVLQLPPVILSHSAFGLYRITAAKVTGQWCRPSNRKGHRLGCCLRLTTQREALLVRAQWLTGSSRLISYCLINRQWYLFRTGVDICPKGSNHSSERTDQKASRVTTCDRNSLLCSISKNTCMSSYCAKI